jgi:hypothetical protein
MRRIVRARSEAPWLGGGDEMRRTRIQRRLPTSRQKQRRQEQYALPLDPRDPDVVGAKALRRGGRRGIP